MASSSTVPNIDVEIVKGLSQPSALYDELVHYILSTVGCKLQNESTLRLVSHAAQVSLEKFFDEAKTMQVASRMGRNDGDSKMSIFAKDETKELDYQIVCETLQKVHPSTHNYNLFLEPNTTF